MPPKFISLSGQTLAAISMNEHLGGTPVVFIHGITANIDLWGPSLPDSIRNGRHWISLSLPGHHPAKIDSATFGPWTRVTPVVWAEWYERALTQLVGDQPVDVVGWSTGGFSGLALAAHYPWRVRSLLSISGFAKGRWSGWLGFFQRLTLCSLTRWGVGIGIRAAGRWRSFFDLVIASAIGDRSSVREQTRQDCFRVFAAHDPVVMTEMFRTIARFDLSDRIGRITCPSLISGGDADPYIPASHTRWIADHVPGAQLSLLPGAGHLFFAEWTRAYQELLVRWLERQGLSHV